MLKMELRDTKAGSLFGGSVEEDSHIHLEAGQTGGVAHDCAGTGGVGFQCAGD